MMDGMRAILQMKKHVILHGFHLSWSIKIGYYCQETGCNFSFLDNGGEGEAMWFKELDRIWENTDSYLPYNQHEVNFIQAVINDPVIDKIIKMKVFL